MRSQSSSSQPTRRALRSAQRRSRRRPALIGATFAVGLLATAGLTATAQAAQETPKLTNFALASSSQAISASPAVAFGAASDDAEAEVDGAIAAADASIAAAEAVVADVSASGLDIGMAAADIAAAVDTTELETAVDELQAAQVFPAGFVTEYTDAVTELSASVDEEVSGLRGKLDAAIALKAEQEAAEKARQEAEAAAAAAAAKAAEEEAARRTAAPSAPSPVYATGGAVGGTSPADAQATARSMIGGYGWGDDQFGCLVALWNRESGWNYQAYNSSSGAFGIPQALPGSKMASAGADWQTNPATQIAWGLGYISGRYGSPCGAWSHSESVGWY